MGRLTFFSALVDRALRQLLLTFRRIQLQFVECISCSTCRLGGAQGLDLFRIDINNRTARALTLGAPFNSTEDDFGIMFMPNNAKKGC